MAIPPCLNLFFFLSHLLIILHLVEGQQYTCPKEFECGKLGKLSFPFTEYNKPSCGLCEVNCHEPEPRINLWVEEHSPEDWFNFTNITKYSSNQIHIEVPKSCFVFQNHPLPNNENISYTITNTSMFTTLLKCNLSFSDDIPDLSKYSGCEEHGFTIYYNYTYGIISDYNEPDLPPHIRHCSRIKVPLKNMSFDEDKFYDILPNEISLEWSFSKDWGCNECFNHSQKCIVNQDNNYGTTYPSYHCKKEKDNNVRLILGSVIGGIAFISVVCGLAFSIWRRKKRNKDGRYVLSRNISSDPSSKPDIEVGSARFLVPVYTYDELEKATDNFDSANELGDGGFGIVYYGRIKDGREVAVKRLYEHNYKRMEHFMNEINILRNLRHPNLVTLYGCTSRHSRELLLVYEYVSNGTVADHIHGSKAEERLLTWPIRMSIALDTANALAYLHKSDIIHRDVKTNNILLDQNFSVKVADFGLSRLFPLDVTHISTAPQGTPGYVDPEYHECYQLTDKSDVYSFGVVLVELISSLPAVDITRHRHEINLSNLAISKIQSNALDELIDLSLGYGSDPEVTRMISNIAELAFRCLQVEKEMRPSMDEVVEILEAIKGGPDKSCVEKGIGISPSPESDGIGLLKKRKLPPSPVSVTEDFFSGSSTTSG